MIAHTLGNPYDLDRVANFAKQHNLWLIEDSCDALGATYNGKKVGTFGDMATVSFYPAHHITMGEGGAVVTNTPLLKTLVESFRDWGRDCWCEPGQRQYLRQALRLATGRAALRLRSQIHLLPHRLQPEADRHAGRHRLVAAGQASRLHRRAAKNFQYLYERLKPLEDRPAAAGKHARRRSQLVWISHRRASRMRPSTATT